jgi:hypothetical protein
LLNLSHFYNNNVKAQELFQGMPKIFLASPEKKAGPRIALLWD